MYVFGAFLVFTGIKMFVDKDKDEEIDTQNHPVVRFANKYFKVHPHFVGSKFFVTIDGVRITIDNPEDMPELKYHGKIRVSDGVDHALKLLQITNNFSYTRDDETNTIHIKITKI
jgi:hypothetical protein